MPQNTENQIGNGLTKQITKKSKENKKRKKKRKNEENLK